MNALVVVPEQLLLLLVRQRPYRLLDISSSVLAADHEADLARGVRRDSSVRVLDSREDFAAGLLEVSDKLQVKPLILSCTAERLS